MLIVLLVAVVAAAGFISLLATAPAQTPIFSTGNPASDGGGGAAFTSIFPTFYNFAYESWLPDSPSLNHTVTTIQVWMTRQGGAAPGYFAVYLQGGGIDESTCLNTDGKPGNGCYAVYPSSYVTPENQSVLVSFDVSGLNWIRHSSTQMTLLYIVAVGSNGDVGMTPSSGYGVSLMWASASSQGTGHYATHAGSKYVLKVPPSFQYYDLAIGGIYETFVPPPAGLTANFTSSSSGLAVSFASSVAGGATPYGYSWNFGDGTGSGCMFNCHPSHTSTAANPTFTYANSGTYTVNLTVSDAVGHTAFAQHTITVSSGTPPPLKVDFSYTVDADGLTARFTSSVSGGLPPYTYSWDLGDTATSTDQNPVHAYKGSGNYTVKLSVTDTKPQTAAATHTISTSAPTPPPTATFSYTAAYLYVTFVGSASGGTPPYAYSWDLGDGGSSKLSSPSHSYVGASTYTVVFTVTDSKQMTGSQSRSVSVSAPPPVPTPLKSADFTTQNIGNSTVSFTSTVDGGNGTISYHWVFGDGTTSALGSPSHQFSGPGSYTVNLTVTDSSGSRKSASHTVAVTAAAGAPLPWVQILGIALAGVGASMAALMLEYKKLRKFWLVFAVVLLVALGAVLIAGVL